MTIEEVGDTAVYLLSDMSRGVTGEIHHVDAGYHIVGMKHPDAPDIVGRQGVSAAHPRNRRWRSPLLYYVRHGETDWNAERRLQGQHDIPLNALGRAQAARCGAILRDLLARDGLEPRRHFDYVSSPLGRARETMELVRAALGLDPTDYRTDARLMEMSFGRWEGFTFAELQATRRSDALAARERDKWNFVPPGGESYADLLARVRAWYATLDARHRGGRPWRHRAGADRHLGIAPPEAAATANVDQGVVYVFAAGGWTKYE